MVQHTVIPRQSLSDKAEELLRQMVLAGQFKAGERINEQSLSEAIGISRGPLREAIRRLSGQGYLVMQPNRGAFVKMYDHSDIVDLYELRSALELYAVRLAVDRATLDEISELEEFVGAEGNEEPPSHQQPVSSEPYVKELGFHQRLALLSKNSAIAIQLEDAQQKLYLALSTTQRTQSRQKQTHHAHREIIDALRDKDQETAVNLLAEHLEDSMRNSLKVLGLDTQVAEEI